MIRAIVQYSTANDDGSVTPVVFAANNYPTLQPTTPSLTACLPAHRHPRVYNIKGQLVRTW